MFFLEAAINKYIALDPEMPARLGQFQGKIICLDIVGTGQKLYLSPQQDYIQVDANLDSEADAILRGSALALFKMSMSRDVAPILLKGEVEIIGDMRLGRAFKSLLSEMQIDWEEHLSAITGDMVAHELMKGVRNVSNWGKQSSEVIAMDIGEYLQEESRDVVSAPELQAFYNEVDELRGDVDRLQARIKQLIQGTQN